MLCNGNASPPFDYVRDGMGDPICPRPIENNAQDGFIEDELGLPLSIGPYVLAFYCVSGCSPAAVTYRVTITGS